MYAEGITETCEENLAHFLEYIQAKIMFSHISLYSPWRMLTFTHNLFSIFCVSEDSRGTETKYWKDNHTLQEQNWTLCKVTLAN